MGEVIYLRGDAPCDTEESVVIDLDELARSARLIRFFDWSTYYLKK